MDITPLGGGVGVQKCSSEFSLQTPVGIIISMDSLNGNLTIILNDNLNGHDFTWKVKWKLRWKSRAGKNLSRRHRQRCL